MANVKQFKKYVVYGDWFDETMNKLLGQLFEDDIRDIDFLNVEMNGEIDLYKITALVEVKE